MMTTTRPNAWFLGTMLRVPIYADMGVLLTVFFVFVITPGTLQAKILGVLAFLLTILAHELGHALVARWRGMQGVQIVISALGGYCTYLPSNNTASQLMISLAGPFMNGLMVLVMWGILMLSDGQAWAADPQSFAVLLLNFASALFWWNLVLGIFNILPIYPMDGGQAFFHGLQLLGNERRARTWTLYASIGAALFTLWFVNVQLGGMNIILPILFFFLLMRAWKDLS